MQKTVQNDHGKIGVIEFEGIPIMTLKQLAVITGIIEKNLYNTFNNNRAAFDDNCSILMSAHEAVEHGIIKDAKTCRRLRVFTKQGFKTIIQLHPHTKTNTEKWNKIIDEYFNGHALPEEKSEEQFEDDVLIMAQSIIESRKQTMITNVRVKKYEAAIADIKAILKTLEEI